MRKFSLAWAFILAFVLTSGAAAQGVPVTIAADLDPASASGIRIEGLVADKNGRLYTADLDSRRFYRVTPETGAVEVLGTLPRSASGMAFDSADNLYMASGDVILRVPAGQLTGTTVDPASVQTFAQNVPGANGLAFDGAGNLYVSGGNTGNIYLVSPAGAVNIFASGFTSDRQEQRISTNGLAFGPDGKLYSANTGSGAIDRITLKPEGGVQTVERFVTSPLLLGADGITFAANGDLYVAANERNAIVKVTAAGQVSDVASNGNTGPLEFPASPAFSGNALYASNFDLPRGANAPPEPGVGASIARIDVGVAGLPLPVAQPAPSAPAAAPSAPAASPSTPAASPSAPAASPSAPVPSPAPTTPSTPPAGAVPAALPNTGMEGIPVLLLLVGVLALTCGMAIRRSMRLS